MLPTDLIECGVWCSVSLYDGQEGCSIPTGYNLHVSQRRCLRCVHHTENPHLSCCCPSAMILEKNNKNLSIVIVIMIFATFGLCRKSDSSICTVDPGPPRTMGPSVMSRVEHTSRSHALININGCLFLHLCFFCCIFHWVFSGPHVHQDQPLLKRQS